MGAPPHTPRGNRKSSREGSLARSTLQKKKNIDFILPLSKLRQFKIIVCEFLNLSFVNSGTVWN
ncbi:unnamed protein product [Tenebrio molitor]|nr:unnamed protein product [Tenebrio molitor]